MAKHKSFVINSEAAGIYVHLCPHV